MNYLSGKTSAQAWETLQKVTRIALLPNTPPHFAVLVAFEVADWYTLREEEQRRSDEHVRRLQQENQ